MVRIESKADGGKIAVLPIHFDVPEDYIPLKTFVETAKAAEGVVESFNQEWLGGELEYEIVVVPPRPGTFLELLAIGVTSVGFGWAFLQSEIGKKFVCGLTGKEPADWAERAGQAVRARVLSSGEPDVISGSGAAERIDATDQSADERKELATALILVETTKAFLVADTSELRRIGIAPETHRNGFEARNSFYQACSEDKRVRAIGFNESPLFPISRQDFSRFQVPLAAREEATDREPWNVGTATLKVTSPNWERDDLTGC
jgi:hypothetical protein